MKIKICIALTFCFIIFVSQKAHPDTEGKVYTDQDLKKFDYEHQTPTNKNKQWSQSYFEEHRDPQSPYYNHVPSNEQGTYTDEQRQEMQQRMNDERMRAQKIQEEQQLQYQMNLQKSIEAATTAAGAFILFFIIVPLIAWITALISVLNNEFKGNNKLIWFLTVTFIPIIGPILYFFMGDKYKIDSDEPIEAPEEIRKYKRVI